MVHQRTIERREKRTKGLCWDCSRKTVPGQTRCAIHGEANNQDRRRRYKEDPEKYHKRTRAVTKRYKSEGRCSRCGAPLAEQDEEKTQCVNCRCKKTILAPINVNPLGVDYAILGKGGSPQL